MTEVLPLHVVVGFDEYLPQDGLADGVVFGVELVKAMERVAILERETAYSYLCLIYITMHHLIHILDFLDGRAWAASGSSPARVSAPYGVHVQRVHAEVERRQVHGLKHLHEGLSAAALDVHDLPGVLLHGSLDEAQQVLLVHAGGRVYVRVHLGTAARRSMVYHASPVDLVCK